MLHSKIWFHLIYILTPFCDFSFSEYPYSSVYLFPEDNQMTQMKNRQTVISANIKETIKWKKSKRSKYHIFLLWNNRSCNFKPPLLIKRPSQLLVSFDFDEIWTWGGWINSASQGTCRCPIFYAVIRTL